MKELIAAAFITGLFFLTSGQVGQTSFKTDTFGDVRIFKSPEKEIKKVIILLSDSTTGWNQSIDHLSQDIAKDGNLILGINMATYNEIKLHGDKTLGKNLDAVSKYVQHLLKMEHYQTPLIISFQTDTQRTFDISTQASTDFFSSINVIGSCPSTPSSIKLNIPIHFFYDQRKDCRTSNDNNKIIYMITALRVPDLSGNSLNLSKWSPEMKDLWREQSRSLASIDSSKGIEIEDALKSRLPLVVLEPKKITADHFVVIYSGDGGWADFTNEIAEAYLAQGIPVVGISSLQYFWKARGIQESTHDLEEIVIHFQNKWSLAKFKVAGFSFGADVAPFLVNQMDTKITASLQKLILLAPGYYAKFEFQLRDWFEDKDEGSSIIEQLKQMKKIPVSCAFGKDDYEGVCSSVERLDHKNIKAYPLNGGHHFNDDLTQIDQLL